MLLIDQLLHGDVTLDTGLQIPVSECRWVSDILRRVIIKAEPVPLTKQPTYGNRPSTLVSHWQHSGLLKRAWPTVLH